MAYPKKRNTKSNQKETYSKKTGCTMHVAGSTTQSGHVRESDNISGWTVARKDWGYTTFIAYPRKGKDIRTKNDHHERWVAIVKFNSGMTERTFSAVYNTNTRQLTIGDLGMVASLNKNYFGSNKKRD